MAIVCAGIALLTLPILRADRRIDLAAQSATQLWLPAQAEPRSTSLSLANVFATQEPDSPHDALDPVVSRWTDAPRTPHERAVTIPHSCSRESLASSANPNCPPALRQDEFRRPSVSAHDPYTSWPYLDSLAISDNAATTGVTGIDPLAPRTLMLWHVSNRSEEEPRLLARTSSRQDEARQESDRARGSFDFGQIAVPLRGLSLVVVPEGKSPHSATPRRLTRALLPAPEATLHLSDRGDARREMARRTFENGRSAASVEIQFRPALLEGELILSNGRDETLARIEIDPTEGTRVFEMEMDAIWPGDDSLLYVTHRLDDGRHSAALEIPLPGDDG